MAVKPGYQQTEVGVIPEDWEVKRVHELEVSGPKNGYSGKTSHGAQGTQTLSLAATSEGRLKLNEATIKRLEEVVPLQSDLYLKPNDVLVQRSNTLDLVGTTAIFDGLPGVFVYPDLMMRLRFSEKTTALWFCRFSNSRRGREFFRTVAAGSAGSMPKVSGANLLGMPIPFPGIQEQKAIADALSDADALITTLERLIAKKHQIQRGAMQELLTGKRRLPGFEVEPGFKASEIGLIPLDWKVGRLSDFISRLQAGVSVKSSNTSGESTSLSVLKTSCVSGGRFFPGEAKPISAGDVAKARVNPRANSILISRMNTPDLIGESGFIGRDFETLFLPDRLWLTTHRESHEVRWLALLLATEPVRARLRESATGTSGSMKNISKAGLLSLLLPVPPSHEEQRAISAVLSDMGAEIETLERKLEKARQIKKGMMQELLTGRIRLV